MRVGRGPARPSGDPGNHRRGRARAHARHHRARPERHAPRRRAGERLAVVATRAVSEKTRNAAIASGGAARGRPRGGPRRLRPRPRGVRHVHVLARLRRAAIGGLGRAAARGRLRGGRGGSLRRRRHERRASARLRRRRRRFAPLEAPRLGGRAARTPSPVRSLRARDARRSPSRDEVSEDLVAALDAAAVKARAVELRSALRRAHMLLGATRSQARFPRVRGPVHRASGRRARAAGDDALGSRAPRARR